MPVFGGSGYNRAVIHAGIAIICVRKCLLCLLMVTAALGARSAEAVIQPLYVAPHLHSTFSDGKQSIREIAAQARERGYGAIWMTDHADIYWQYRVLGVPVGYRRKSLRESGFDNYLRECVRVQQANPDLLVLPGFEASPYYFWQGTPCRKQLVNHQWMKHLIVVGVEDPQVFKKLPMLAYGGSRYSPSHLGAGEAPYQDFVAAVQAAGGMAYWAHPLIGRTRKVWGHISSAVTPYAESLLTVPDSQGIAVRRVDDVITEPGGIWDRALTAYCAGTRPVPPWPMVELDYHRGSFPAGPTLALWLPAATPPDASARKVAAVRALRGGHYYVTNAAPGVLQLATWQLQTADGHTATAGETLTGNGPVTVSYSIATQKSVQWVQLIRNGRVMERGNNPAGSWTDGQPAMVDGGNRSYYRLAARTTTGQFILSTPIFLELTAPATPKAP
jgi:hypothetical protein